MRYRIEMGRGRYNYPHYYRGFDKKDGYPRHSIGFLSWKTRGTAEKHLAAIEASESKAKWEIVEYEEGG